LSVYPISRRVDISAVSIDSCQSSRKLKAYQTTLTHRKYIFCISFVLWWLTSVHALLILFFTCTGDIFIVSLYTTVTTVLSVIYG